MGKTPTKQVSTESLESTAHTHGTSTNRIMYLFLFVLSHIWIIPFRKEGLSQRWTKLIKSITNPALNVIKLLARTSAMNPKITISSVLFISVALLSVGLLTGFDLVTDEVVLWTPVGTYSSKHEKWIKEASGFRIKPRDMTILFHSGGSSDILTREVGTKIMQVVASVTSLPDYQAVCIRDRSGTCPIIGITKFWNHSLTIFQSNVTSDQDYIEQISVLAYPVDGTPVSVDDILGHAERNSSSGLLISAQCYFVTIRFPEDSDEDNILSEDFETRALEIVFRYQELWKDETFKVETFAKRSISDEFERAIVNDVPLVPIVFLSMSLFTCIVFFKRDKVQSRSLLGFMAVVSIFLSIMAGYGLLFVFGVVFTSMTQMLLFVFFGVGLDDAFIISGCFFRLDPKTDIIDRIEKTADEIGLSIFITTLTTAIAFCLGCTSSIPAIYWLCLYAVPTIALILLFQLTFFIACIVLDERRVAANHRDALHCMSFLQKKSSPSSSEVELKDSAIDRFMIWFVHKLMLPSVKMIVLLIFIGFAVACTLSTTNLRQEFIFTDVVPGDSYVKTFTDSYQSYSSRSSVSPFVYFRLVNQSDADVQKQMDTFVTDLVSTDAIILEPDYFWVRDFSRYVDASFNRSNDMRNKSSNEQMSLFLSNSLYYELYSDHIVRDESGTVVTSRCRVHMDNIDLYAVNGLVKALKDQEKVTMAQQVNQGESEMRFFTYSEEYNTWEFFYKASREIRGTVICGVAAVSFATLLIIPHWTAVLFAFPLTCVLFIDFLGVLQWAGVKVNPVSYVTLVMAIGLLVDYLLHVLLRYYETPGNRQEKVIEVLRSMGSSVLMGGITTFLGTVPLAFSSSEIFSTVFIAFITLVVLGISHGLILLPVILSTIGPEDTVCIRSRIEEQQAHGTKEFVGKNNVDDGEEEDVELFA